MTVLSAFVAIVGCIVAAGISFQAWKYGKGKSRSLKIIGLILVILANLMIVYLLLTLLFISGIH